MTLYSGLAIALGNGNRPSAAKLLAAHQISTPFGAGQFAPATPANWDIAREAVGGTGLKQYMATNVSTAELLYCDIGSPQIIPADALSPALQRRLIAVTAEVRGITSGTLPLTMPTLKVYEPVGTLLDTATDSSASNAAFTAIHTFSCVFDPTIEATAGCFLARLSAPTGGGTSAGFRVYSIKAHWELAIAE